ncbi:hypothetical protein QBC37DRAFT_375480 [Rhypophila decipiens]|uniref:Chitin deacetylase n=1 Tax=Rhypophila decipiens TaxID=261697 RepID=A0AAN6Y3T7_9PEZI|nr:hypothetical protein QBC37DRAFT_375480 [Rhypophila decipiens]
MIRMRSTLLLLILATTLGRVFSIRLAESHVQLPTPHATKLVEDGIPLPVNHGVPEQRYATNLDPKWLTMLNSRFNGMLKHCAVTGATALTFDDGPFIYTSHILDQLET